MPSLTFDSRQTTQTQLRNGTQNTTQQHHYTLSFNKIKIIFQSHHPSHRELIKNYSIQIHLK